MIILVGWPDTVLYLGLATIILAGIAGITVMFKPTKDPESVQAINNLKNDFDGFSKRIDTDMNTLQKELLVMQTPIATNTAIIDAVNKRVEAVDQYTHEGFRELKDCLNKMNANLEIQAKQQQQIVQFFTTMQKES